jgi:hypothetical protein
MSKIKKQNQLPMDEWDLLASKIIDLEVMLHEFSDFLTEDDKKDIEKQLEKLEQKKQKLIIPTTYSFKIGNTYGQDYVSDIEEDDLE